MSLFGKMFGEKEGAEERSYPLDAGLVAFFTQDHRNCDLDWTDLESSLESGEKDLIIAKWKAFDGGLRRHFDMEEKEFFPQFEQVTGMTNGGPTFVMKMEHTQMRGVLDQMQVLVDDGNYEEVRNQGDTLLMLIQQHNVKEEGMLYPMSEQHLSGKWDQIKAKLETYIKPE